MCVCLLCVRVVSLGGHPKARPESFIIFHSHIRPLSFILVGAT